MSASAACSSLKKNGSVTIRLFSGTPGLKPSLHEAGNEKLLTKASRSIRAAERLLEEGDVDFAASRAYDALFYVAEALLNEMNLHFKKHGGVHGVFAEHCIKTKRLDPKFHSWWVDAFDERIQGDDEVESQVDSQDVAAMIQQACEFLQEARRYLGSPP